MKVRSKDSVTGDWLLVAGIWIADCGLQIADWGSRLSQSEIQTRRHGTHGIQEAPGPRHRSEKEGGVAPVLRLFRVSAIPKSEIVSPSTKHQAPSTKRFYLLSSIFYLLFAISFPIRGAKAATQEKVGTVIAVEGDKVRFDLGSEDGVVQGMTLEVGRNTAVVHPLTKKSMGSVQVKIGELEATEVTARSSWGRMRSQETPVKEGDRVKRLDETSAEGRIRQGTGEDEEDGKKKRKRRARRKKVVAIAPMPSDSSSPSLPLSPSPPPAFAIPEELSAPEDTASSLLERALRRKYRGAFLSLYSGVEGENDSTSSQTSVPSMEPYEAHFWAGQYLYQKGRYSDAAEHFEAMLEDDSRTDKDDRAGILFGFCWYELGDRKEAMRAFEKMLADCSESPYAPQAQSWIARIEEETDERKK